MSSKIPISHICKNPTTAKALGDINSKTCPDSSTCSLTLLHDILSPLEKTPGQLLKPGAGKGLGVPRWFQGQKELPGMAPYHQGKDGKEPDMDTKSSSGTNSGWDPGQLFSLQKPPFPHLGVRMVIAPTSMGIFWRFYEMVPVSHSTHSLVKTDILII